MKITLQELRGIISEEIEAAINESKKRKSGIPAEWEHTVKAMKKSTRIENPWALVKWMISQGYKPHKKSKGD